MFLLSMSYVNIGQEGRADAGADDGATGATPWAGEKTPPLPLWPYSDGKVEHWGGMLVQIRNGYNSTRVNLAGLSKNALN